MRIDELKWEKVYPWKIIRTSPNKTVYHFKNDKNIDYSVKFTADEYTLNYVNRFPIPVVAYDLSFTAMVDSDSIYSLTGTGDVVGVFSTVAEITQDFVNKRPDVNTLIFVGLAGTRKPGQSTPNLSRPKFYKSRVQLLAKKLNWDYIVGESAAGDVTILMTKEPKIYSVLQQIFKNA
jgi:hypothetical protein